MISCIIGKAYKINGKVVKNIPNKCKWIAGVAQGRLLRDSQKYFCYHSLNRKVFC